MVITEAEKKRVYLHLEKIRLNFDARFFSAIKRFLDEELILILLNTKHGVNLESIKKLVQGRYNRLVTLFMPLYKEAALSFFHFQSKSKKGIDTLEPQLLELAQTRAQHIIDGSISLIESVYARTEAKEFITSIPNIYRVPSRAMRIAKTEVNMVSNFALIKAASYDGLKKKIWVSRKDKVIRESHSVLDLETRNIEDFFSNGLLFPGDPTQGVKNIINCRCFQIFI